MAYVLIENLTDEYIQSLIKRCGFTDVTSDPEWYGMVVYAIQDLNNQVYQFYDMDSARRFLIESYQLSEPYSTGISTNTDQAYADGTVVCPSSSAPFQFVQCTHDNCPFAMVYVEDSISSAGQVRVKTAFDILSRTHVVSDGRGGVRAAASGESAFVLGFTVNETVSAAVDIILKSFFGVVS